MKFQRGSFVVQTIVVLAIIGVLVGVFTLSFGPSRRDQLMKTTTDDVVALLNEARSRTLSSENSMQYGVHIQSDKAVMFSGTTYTAGLSTNRTVTFGSGATAGSISLADGGTDVIFNRLNGTTSQYGTIVISVSGMSQTKTITIVKTGIVSSN